MLVCSGNCDGLPPEQAYKSCVGILSFAKKVGHERLTKACQRALGYGAYNYKTIQKILELQLDQKGAPDQNDQFSMPLHDNICGGKHYQYPFIANHL